MNDLKCYLVSDLLPLYIDKICCEQTAKDIEAHLQTCESCRKIYKKMNTQIGMEHAAPEFEEKKLFRHVKKHLLGIMAALLVTIVCLLLNMGGAWQGDLAGMGNLVVSIFYILFWSLFSFAVRNYAPLVNFSIGVSSLTLISSLVAFAAALSGGGGFITAFLALFAAVPFYGLRFFMGWTGLYGFATLLSLCWLAYSAAAKYRITHERLPGNEGQAKLGLKKKLILTAAFLVSLMPMLLNQYGGKRGVQEISGLINLFNPIGAVSVCLFFLGVWGIYKKRIVNRILGIAGTGGIVLAELYEFATWHVSTITGKVSLENSIRFAFPEFYVGLVVSVAMIIAFIILEQRIKEP